MKKSNPFELNKVESQIMDWNSKFPFDFQFRTKYNIPFGSEKHRQMDFFDMKFDIHEEKYFRYLSHRNKNKSKNLKQLFKTSVIQTSNKISEDEFEDIDLSQFDSNG